MMNSPTIRKAYWSIVTTLLVSATANAADIHRVVTGLDANNKAIVLFDSRLPLEVVQPGNPYAVLWTTDSYPAGFSQQDAGKSPIGIPPPDNGTKFNVVEFLPVDDATLAKMDPNFFMKLVGASVPARGLPPNNPLIHRTRTVDYAIVMSGEIDLVLDDTTIHLKAGDVVVQQATNHAWINRGKEPCRMIFVLMDSKQP
jgi:mannose-6-phosphate isomerase-like protein (cupin superfamily)